MPQTEAQIEKLIENLEIVAALRERIKRCSMIYQYEDKCRAAAHFGMDPQALFDMAFVEWMELRARYFHEIEQPGESGLTATNPGARCG